MKPAPILISVPHGGMDTPEECRERSDLSALEIFEDGDGFTRQIYDFRDKAVAYVDTTIARAFIDVNRKRDDMAPRNPDGVIKSETVLGVPVYRQGVFPDEFLVEQLLKKYYDPYHQKLREHAVKTNITIAFDCHSMLERAPRSSPQPGKHRPLICISNGIGQTGKNQGDVELTCSFAVMNRFAEMLAHAFEIPLEQVALNDPFTGGHIIRSHFNGDIPWIQLELNRSLYLTDTGFDRECLTCDPAVVAHLRECVWTAMISLLNYL